MNHCKVSVYILLSLVLLCICSLMELQKQCQEYLLLVENVESAVNQDNTAQALTALDTLETHWESYHNINGIFVNGSELDSLREIMSGLRPLIIQNPPQADSEIQKMKNLILSIYEEELPEIWHIL